MNYNTAIEEIVNNKIKIGKEEIPTYDKLTYMQQDALIHVLVQENEDLRQKIVDIINGDLADKYCETEKKIEARALSFGDLVTSLRNVCNDANVTSVNRLKGGKKKEFDDLYMVAWTNKLSGV